MKTNHEIATDLLAGSASLREVAAPNSAGFKAVQAWLFDRELELAEEYDVLRKHIYKLTFVINEVAGKGPATKGDKPIRD